MHTNPASSCETCTSKLSQCDKRIADFVREVQGTFTECHVCYGYRDQADQHLAYVTHKSTFDWPDSKHNRLDQFGKPCAIACDLFMLGPDGKAYFAQSYYEKIWLFYKSNIPKFPPINYMWGGLYVHLKDFDHFEVVEGQLVKASIVDDPES